MRRLLQWAFNGAAVVSAMLLVVTSVLWIRSYWNEDVVSISSGRQLLVCESDSGTTAFVWDTGFPHPQPVLVTRPAGSGRLWLRSYVNEEGWHGIENNIQWRHVYETTVTFRVAILRSAYLAMVTSLLPAIKALAFVFRRRKNVRGCCSTCGYDLRATPNLCPECGAVPRVKEAT
jgi:hypothetical protein